MPSLLLSTFRLHIFCQGIVSRIELGVSSWSTLYANFTENAPLETFTHINSSGFGLKGIGTLKMA